MADAKRPYTSLTIEDLVALYRAHSDDLDILSHLVQELSFRTTPKERQLLAFAAKRLAELEPEPDGPENNSDDALLSATLDEGNEDPVIMTGPTRLSKTTIGSDHPPDDRRRPERLSRIRPVGTAGLPQAWVRPLKNDRPLNVSPDAEPSQVYVAALVALIAEIKSTGVGQHRYELENGVRAEGNEPVYEFAFAEQAELFEDAEVEIEVFGRRISASIVSISAGRLWLSIGEELGDVLKRAVLLVHPTALLEALKLRIEEAGTGEISLNLMIANAVVGKGQPPPDPSPIPEAPSNGTLVPSQSKARGRALIASVTYIWGPPGCGKTYVLSDVVRSNFEAGKRVLICSNTNKAVDQVLFQTCKNLGKEHPAMEQGRIVRLGTISDAKLGEALRADWMHVSWKSNSIFIPESKSGEPRTVTMQPKTRAALHRLWVSRGSDRGTCLPDQSRRALSRSARLQGAERKPDQEGARHGVPPSQHCRFPRPRLAASLGQPLRHGGHRP